MKKIFVVPNGESNFGVSMVALTEDGDCIAGHLSSNTTWGRHDMGIGSDWKHDLYDKEYGAGEWELLYADDIVMNSPEFLLAVQRNHEKAELAETEDEETE
ncbi:hypothetical protein [Yersinia phage fHe-Yen9-03]|uniref:Uncharacterized protein n=1 Tax=Yersinia phage fHe-Yen9-03 TaxID=2052743 RepID=A0A2C9CYY1_9CAUD|nr:hypothetical protein [Yersinia phage fHe-Yen9-03]